LGLGAEIIISRKFSWAVVGGVSWDVEHLVVERLESTLAEETKAEGDSFVKILRFVRLGRVEDQRV
jgi:hypothetical protein